MATIKELIEKARQQASKNPQLKIHVERKILQNPAAETEKKTEGIPQAIAPIKQNDSNQEKDSNTRKPAVELNPEQLRACQLGLEGSDFCLIGAAGTGKTTTLRTLLEDMIANDKLPPFQSGTKYLFAGTPSCAIVSYTRRAVRVLRRNMPDGLRANAITIHKLLEYEPVWYEIETPDGPKNTMRFEPQRTALRPVPGIKLVVIDESSMCSVDLYEKLRAACPNAHFIFVGDIQQLPPVFGSAILGFKLLTVPVVELTHVYRQALESPIIKLAHRILSGKPLPPDEWKNYEKPGELTIRPFKKRVEGSTALLAMKQWMRSMCRSGDFNPETDVILCPFNVSLGTKEFNKTIADEFGKIRGAPVFEIIAGFQEHYFAVGDRVLVDKMDGIIAKIVRNGKYTGKPFKKENINLNRWGQFDARPGEDELHLIGLSEDQAEFMLENEDTETDERKAEASHIIDVTLLDDEGNPGPITETLNTAGEINNLDFSYALSIHKSQGSEWDKVYLILHQSHATMNQRELLYTGVTRAKRELYIVCENRSLAHRKDSTFETGILSQKIKGNSLAEKAEFFKGKLDSNSNLAERIL